MPQKRSKKGSAKGRAMLKKLGVAKGSKKRVAARAKAVSSGATKARRRAVGRADRKDLRKVASIAKRAKKAGLSGKAFSKAVRTTATKGGLLVSRKGRKSIGLGRGGNGKLGGRSKGGTALKASTRFSRADSSPGSGDGG